MVVKLARELKTILRGAHAQRARSAPDIRAARSAALLTRFFRSAPVKPEIDVAWRNSKAPKLFAKQAKDVKRCHLAAPGPSPSWPPSSAWKAGGLRHGDGNGSG